MAPFKKRSGGSPVWQTASDLCQKRIKRLVLPQRACAPSVSGGRGMSASGRSMGSSLNTRGTTCGSKIQASQECIAQGFRFALLCTQEHTGVGLSSSKISVHCRSRMPAKCSCASLYCECGLAADGLLLCSRMARYFRGEGGFPFGAAGEGDRERRMALLFRSILQSAPGMTSKACGFAVYWQCQRS